MKFRPILFSTPMVQSVIADIKNLTRRTKGLEVINENPNKWYLLTSFDNPNDPASSISLRNNEILVASFTNGFENIEVKCPYGQVGDVLWVRESFISKERFTELEQVLDYYYKSDDNKFYDVDFPSWCPSIHMPKEACRLFLKIKDIRVERLQDISEQDIKLEGVMVPVSEKKHPLFSLGKENSAWSFLPQKIQKTGTNNYSEYDVYFSFWAELWCKINGRKSWDLNPWVWVIEFERIDKPENFI